MTHDELTRLLRSAPPPPRNVEYWHEFPAQVVRKIQQTPRTESATAHSRDTAVLFPAWLKELGLVGACAAALCLLLPGLRLRTPAPGEPRLAALRTYYRNIEEMFPHQFEAVLVTSEGVQLQLSTRANVPNSPPLYVRICTPSRCTTAVTFSGQSIRVDGKEFEVLATGQGEILVLAREGVRSPGNNPVSGQQWRFETGWL